MQMLNRRIRIIREVHWRPGKRLADVSLTHCSTSLTFRSSCERSDGFLKLHRCLTFADGHEIFLRGSTAGESSSLRMFDRDLAYWAVF
jgi:hypothetical protein